VWASVVLRWVLPPPSAAVGVASTSGRAP